MAAFVQKSLRFFCFCNSNLYLSCGFNEQNVKKTYMKKTLIFAAVVMAGFTTASAGGFLTNTNASASFGRYFALEGYNSIEGAYYNPSGIGFLNKGWHLAFNNQSAFQTRTALSTFNSYKYGAKNNGLSVKKYKGKATAPIIPSLDLGYVGDKWFGSFHFGIVGGGGKCEFNDGLGSFESVVSMLPTAIDMLIPGLISTDFYDMNSYMRGKQYFMGAQFGVGYKILPELSVSIGGRLVYATSNYYGYVSDITFLTKTRLPISGDFLPAGSKISAGDLFNVAAVATGKPQIAALGEMVSNVGVNCDQTGWGFAPIIAMSYKKGPLSIGARYEFKTRLRMENRSDTKAEQTAILSNLAEFEDGKKIPNDIPALLGIGVGYEFTPKLRANVAAHVFFDKQAHQYENKQKLLAGNTWELLAGVEYDINKQWTVSAGGQFTNYGLGKEKKYISDLSFTTSSYSLGAGVKFKVTDKIGINLSYFKTLYYSTRKTQADYNNLGGTTQNLIKMAVSQDLITPTQAAIIQRNMQAKIESGDINLSGNDLFDRTNDVISIGVDINF